MSSLHFADAIRKVCDKGHNWITTRANKIKTVKKGYSKIRPVILPKGLSEFKKEHCDNFDADYNDIFLKCDSRKNSKENAFSLEYREIFVDNFSAVDFNGFDF